jgi:hypothetical protein
MKLALILPLASASLMVACAATPVAQPAKLAGAMTSVCLNEMAAFASRSTGRMVTLAPSDFTQSDTVVLSQVPARDAQGRLLDGRMREPVSEVLKLTSSGQSCILTHVQSGAQAVLQSCGTCTAYKP